MWCQLTLIYLEINIYITSIQNNIVMNKYDLVYTLGKDCWEIFLFDYDFSTLYIAANTQLGSAAT